MMNKKTKIAIIAIAVVALVAFAYFYYFSINTKEKALTVLKSSGLLNGYEASAFDNLEEGYLIAWAKAVRILKSTFDYNENTYITNNGASLT